MFEIEVRFQELHFLVKKVIDVNSLRGRIQ